MHLWTDDHVNVENAMSATSKSDLTFLKNKRKSLQGNERSKKSFCFIQGHLVYKVMHINLIMMVEDKSVNVWRTH